MRRSDPQGTSDSQVKLQIKNSEQDNGERHSANMNSLSEQTAGNFPVVLRHSKGTVKQNEFTLRGMRSMSGRTAK